MGETLGVIIALISSALGGTAAAVTRYLVSGADPLKAGLMESLNRPGGNVTGVSLIGSALEAKRLELLASLAPGGLIGVLVNPKYPDAENQVRELTDAANVIKLETDVMAGKRHIVVADMRGMKTIHPSIAKHMGEAIGYQRAR